jgi:hypothetical protein
MADIFDIESLMGDLTEEEADEVFKPVSRRAANFGVYQMLLNTQAIGQKKHVNIPADHPKPDEAARDLKYNLNEAAKERTVWKSVTLNEDEAAQFAANKRIERFERQVPSVTDPENGDSEGYTMVIQRMKGGEWKTEVKEPVVLRWKIDTKDVEREVTEDGKTVKKTVKVPTRMYYVSVATEAIRKRAPRAAKPEETAPTAPTEGQTVEGELQVPMPDATNGEVKEAVAV